MGLTLLSESHGSSLEITKTVNVDQGRPILIRQAVFFETAWGMTIKCLFFPEFHSSCESCNLVIGDCNPLSAVS